MKRKSQRRPPVKAEPMTPAADAIAAIYARTECKDGRGRPVINAADFPPACRSLLAADELRKAAEERRKAEDDRRRGSRTTATTAEARRVPALAVRRRLETENPTMKASAIDALAAAELKISSRTIRRYREKS